jgi:creatinine amidohydrolase/Fe(II)-dependent formamide hydrolase-like protein
MENKTMQNLSVIRKPKTATAKKGEAIVRAVLDQVINSSTQDIKWKQADEWGWQRK